MLSSSMIYLSIKLHTLLHEMVFFWFWGKGSLKFCICLEIEKVLGYLGAGFLVENHFAKDIVRILRTFQKSLLRSCPFSCCSHWSCAH